MYLLNPNVRTWASGKKKILYCHQSLQFCSLTLYSSSPKVKNAQHEFYRKGRH
jgi:hypothetical protein